MRIMILDDEDLIRESLKDFFEDMEWDVFTFSGAEEALDFLHQQTLDYMTVDLRLPGMNGVDFILQVHEIQPRIKFAIYTGSINFVLNDELRAIGITEQNLLYKPILEMMDIFRALTGSVPAGG